MAADFKGKTSAAEGKLILAFCDTEIAILVVLPEIVPVECGAETFDVTDVVKTVILDAETVGTVAFSTVALSCHFEARVVCVSFNSGTRVEITSLLVIAATEMLNALDVIRESTDGDG